MNGFAVPGWRGGSGCSASRSSVWGSNITSRGPSPPTQMETIRPWRSNVTDAHSATWKVDCRSMLRPRGPENSYAPDM